ncbi:MAG: Fe-S cluster assembly protein HesB [Microthrixaceae bacterium]|nr:Fe-S cluster assembly protein HesB [Microthrixaceae bacterium]
MTDAAIPITGDEQADGLLTENPLALLLGMLLDQQVPMEWAFRGPATLAERLGGLDAASVARMDPEEFVAVCARKPAIHRFPASMGERIHAVCTVVAQDYQGDAAAIWRDAQDADELRRRLLALPGYGEEKTKIFIAILAKRFGIRPAGWERVAAPFSDAEPRSVADVDSPESLARVREWKKMMKAARKAKSDPVA